MGYRIGLVAHGLRALTSKTLNELGHNPDVIEAALTHDHKNKVRRLYNRAEYLERKRILTCCGHSTLKQRQVEKPVSKVISSI
jgi:hypothetical protein